MQLKKLSFMAAFVVLAGTVLSGCSLKEKMQIDPKPDAPAVMEEVIEAPSLSPMPSQSTSSEVTDLESDLKMVKFDQESFE